MIEKWGALLTGPRGRWVTLLAWIAIAAVLTVTLPAVGDEERNNSADLREDAPSAMADAMIREYFPSSAGLPALLVWHREEGLAPEDYAHMQHLTKRMEEQPLEGQGDFIPFHKMPLPALMQFASENGNALVQPIAFEAGIDSELLKDNLERIQDWVRESLGTDPFAAEVDGSGGLAVRISGPAGILVDATELFLGADVVLLISTVLLVLVLLLLIYRSPILAIIPLIGVGFAYAVTSPLLGWMASQGWITVDAQSISIMTVLLFGAGTDYCLFFIARFRQELRQQSNRYAAMTQSFKGASGAIAMSGFTVVLSLLALLAAHYGSNHRFAVPFSLSIFIMMLASLTLVPALLAIIGRASFFPFVPRTTEMERERAVRRGKPFRMSNEEGRLGNKVGKLVVAKPWTVVIACTLALGIFASFAPGIKYTYELLSSFPDDIPSKEGFRIIEESYAPGELAPVTVLARVDGASADIAAKLGALPQIDHVGAETRSETDADIASYSVILSMNPYSAEAMKAIPVIAAAAQEALGEAGVADAAGKVWVAGQTASQLDAKTTMDRDNRVVMPLVIGLIALLLLFYLRSAVAAAYLMATVLLSFGAALGLGWIILHYGMGAEAIQGAIPLYSFVFLIALGEDYNIFMVSSIWKKRKAMPLRRAIVEGVAQTGGVITSAGLILAATFAVLTTLPMQVLIQFGLITAIGVLLDTFVVRPLLVPAMTALLGKRAFWPGKPAIAEERAVKQPLES